ncbi:DNA cytosine methyltransferase [Pseudobacillus sp. 179-B 2D1 NHS]|uniref:DNA cytosine methyltransferase n=1 Tax=Pseudobacillus sp. 179-B 2D1 NHS TaxID=3374292 RepID=UPI0038798A5F
MLIKKRTAKPSSRGIYLQDNELKETQFKPGEKYRWVLDPKNKKIIILPKSTEGNVVSKRKRKEEIFPVIDIRKKEVLSIFKEVDYLQIEIFEDRILVEGYVKDEDIESTFTKVGKNVSHITHFLKVNKKASISIARDQLRMAAGDISQDWIHSTVTSLSESTGQLVSMADTAPLKELEVPLQIGSLFSGAGMMDYAFIQEGFDIAYAIEQDPDAAETYRENIGDHVQVRDITKVNKASLPTVPILIGGSPCQGFSNSNRITNYLDNPNNVLVREYIKTVKENPNVQIFVLENVPQLLTAGNGQFVEEIKQELSDFIIDAKVLDAADYGASMHRKRAFLVGSKVGKIEWPEPIVRTYQTVRDAFRGIHGLLPNQQDVSIPKEETRKRMSFVPPGGNIHDIPKDIRPKGTHSTMYRRLEWDKPACSIVNFRKAVIMPPDENRILSVREAARLFGIDDSFVFKGRLSKMQQQVANGVPQPLGRAIAREVKKAILRFHVRMKNMFRRKEANISTN